MAWLDRQLSPLRAILQSREYTIKGSLSFVNVLGADGQLKTMNFRRLGPKHEISGPFVAKANALDQFLIISPWRGVPPVLDNEATARGQCADCLAECNFCKGSGKIACQSFGCGGCGTAHLPVTHFQDDATGVAHCHDASGERAESCPKCATCEGSGKMPCNVCIGTGKRATGKRDQSIAEYKASNVCPSCNGSGWRTREIPVKLGEFASGAIGSWLEIGPIVAFTVQPPSDSPARKTVLTYDCKENLEGDPMSLLLSSGTQIPCEAFLLGGFAQERM